MHACGRYDGVLRTLIHALKYHGRTSLAAPLGRLTADHGALTLAGADLLVPVPLHPAKRLIRGFNQSTHLARAMGLPVVAALARRRWTTSQTALSGRERQRNIRGAFAQRSTARRVRGKTVVLVDDVWTTGATLTACADVLLAAGAAEVRSLVVARAEPPQSHRPRPQSHPGPRPRR